MGRYDVDRTVSDHIGDRPDVKAILLELGYAILEDSDKNIVTSSAIDTGRLLSSGEVEQEGALTRVSYDAASPEGFQYGPVVHDGSGRGRNAVPRPFLLASATQRRSLR